MVAGDTNIFEIADLYQAAEEICLKFDPNDLLEGRNEIISWKITDRQCWEIRYNK